MKTSVHVSEITGSKYINSDWQHWAWFCLMWNPSKMDSVCG